MTSDFILDGECVGDLLYAFDLLEWDGEDLRIKPYQRRFPIACWWFLIVVRRFRITDSSS